MGVLTEFLDYHAASSKARDIDPANDCLRYIANRFELNIEQRYWLAFLYATCYSAPTAFYIYNEFPDFENVDIGRLRRWWAANKNNCVFQTDRRWVKSNDQFPDIYLSYKKFVGGEHMKQRWRFMIMDTANPQTTYDLAMDECSDIYTFGRFTLFIYLEMIHVLTGFPLEPTRLDLKFADSSRNGLAFALGKTGMMNHNNHHRLSSFEYKLLNQGMARVMAHVKKRGIEHSTIWNVETTLCAFKKFKLGKKRWVGYYIQRMKKEIEKMETNVTEGVCWDVLWQFRKETYEEQYTKNDCNRGRTRNREDDPHALHSVAVR